MNSTDGYLNAIDELDTAYAVYQQHRTDKIKKATKWKQNEVVKFLKSQVGYAYKGEKLADVDVKMFTSYLNDDLNEREN